jgi:two-component system chemotaxis response regulator CheY
MADIDVMIVDDEAFVRKTLTQMLKLCGVHRITEATNGRHALSELVSLPEFQLPNLILCDLEMELMGGIEFLESLRSQENESIATLPVIVSTAHTDVETVRAAAALDIDGYLVKPFNAAKLRARLQAVIGTLPNRSVLYSAMT